MRLRWFPVAAAMLFQTACAGFLISPAQEVQIGQGVEKQVDEQYKVLEKTDPLTVWAQGLVNGIAASSARFRDPKEFGGYKVQVIDSHDVVNAFAAPGGFVYITSGLIEEAGTCAEIAGVLSHELAHVTQRHSVKQIERSFAAETLAQMFLQQGLAQDAALTIFNFLQQTTFSREQEAEADHVGVQIAYGAGYNPYGLADFFKKLLALEKKQGGKVPTFLSSHPATADRIKAVDTEIQNLYDGKVVPGKTQSYKCIGTNMTLEDAQQRIKSGEMQVRPGTGTKPQGGG
jgi:predicted Zn-dependent protease